MRDKIEMIDIDKIVPNPEQSRKPNPNDVKILAENIKIHGQLENIILKKVGDTYVLGGGEYRVEAFRLLGQKKIRAVIIECSDDELAEIALSENMCRKDLTSIEREEKVYKRWKSGKYNYRKDLAKAIGISPARVGQLIDSYEQRIKMFKDITKGPLVSTEIILSSRAFQTVEEQKKFIERIDKGDIRPTDADEASKNLISYPEDVRKTVLEGKFPYEVARVRMDEHSIDVDKYKKKIDNVLHTTQIKAYREKTPKDRAEIFKFLMKISQEIEPSWIIDLKDKGLRRWSKTYARITTLLFIRLSWKLKIIDDEKYQTILKLLEIEPDRVEHWKGVLHYGYIETLEWRDDFKNLKILRKYVERKYRKEMEWFKNEHLILRDRKGNILCPECEKKIEQVKFDTFKPIYRCKEHGYFVMNLSDEHWTRVNKEGEIIPPQ